MGTRIAPVARGLPKSLIPVAGRPFIERQFARIAASGLRNVLLCVGAGGDLIEAHVGGGAPWGLDVRYSREAPDHLLGTGGALVRALPMLDDAFLVMYGDSYLSIDFAAVARAFRASTAGTMMTVYRNDGRWDASNARVRDGRVVFYSKAARPGEADRIDYGLTAFRRSVIQAYEAAPMPLDLARILSDRVAADDLLAYEAQKRFFEIGKPAGWRELDAMLRGDGRERND